MSSRRRAGLSEGKGAVSVDLFLEALFAHWFFNHIDPATEYLGQAPFKSVQAADGVETRLRKILSQADNHADVGRRVLATRY